MTKWIRGKRGGLYKWKGKGRKRHKVYKKKK